MFDICFAIFV